MAYQMMYRFQIRKIIKAKLILNKYKLQDEEVLDEKLLQHRNSAYIITSY
jgi:hypothetical protein